MQLFPNVDINKLWEATTTTLYMTLITTFFVFVLGLLLGILTFVTDEGQLYPNRFIHQILSILISTFRSIPFIILIVLLIPFTKILIGTIIGKNAALPALILAAAPFYARLVEMALREVNSGVIEASQAMGATSRQIILKVLIPEGLPALLSGLTVTTIAVLGYTVMAAVIGSGGLGYYALYDGFYRNRTDITLVTTFISILIVFIIQMVGDFFVSIIDHR